MIVIGIDPGLTGAIACLGHQGEILALMDMPVMERAGAKAYVKKQVNPGQLREELLTILEGHDRIACHAFIETPIAFPGQHVATTAAAFLTGGHIEATISSLHIAHTLVRPADWKKALKLSDSKEQARARAIRMFPSHQQHLGRVKDHNRAEALLIAAYGREQVH